VDLLIVETIELIVVVVVLTVVVDSLDFGVDVEPDIRHHSSFSTPQVPVSSVYATSVISGEQHG